MQSLKNSSKMKNLNCAIACGLIGVLSFCVVADSLNTNNLLANPCPENFSGNIRDPESCQNFYSCINGVGTRLSCPANLCYNGAGGYCDYCQSVDCGSATGAPSTSAPSTTKAPTTPGPTQSQKPSTPPASTTTQKATTPGGGNLPCPNDKPFIYMPYPGDCTKFYYCQNGVNTGVHRCGTGLWFRPRLQVCDLPWGSSCNIDN